MDFGLHLPASSANVKPEDLVRFAQQAEELGFYCLTVADHVIVPKNISTPYPYTVDGKYPGTGYHLETLTTMSFLAGATQRIRFATSVMIAPYRNPIIGWPSDIENLTREEVLQYFKTFYAPNNCIAAIVGDIDPQRTLAILEKYFGPIPAQIGRAHV